MIVEDFELKPGEQFVIIKKDQPSSLAGGGHWIFEQSKGIVLLRRESILDDQQPAVKWTFRVRDDTGAGREWIEGFYTLEPTTPKDDENPEHIVHVSVVVV